MKTKVTFNIVTPSKAEDKKIKKILSEAEKNKDTFDLSKAKHPDGKAIKKKQKKPLDLNSPLHPEISIMRKIEKIGEYTRTRQPLKTYKQTVADCFDLARLYWKDLLLFNANGVPIKDLTIHEFYEYVKSINYVKDPHRKEHVSRPKILLERANTDHPFDCDDRSILSLSFFHLQNNLFGKEYKTRLAVTGRYTKPKHIYVEFKDESNPESQWTPYDCTYPWNYFGKTLYIPQFKRVFYEENHPVKK